MPAGVARSRPAIYCPACTGQQKQNIDATFCVADSSAQFPSPPLTPIMTVRLWRLASRGIKQLQSAIWLDRSSPIPYPVRGIVSLT